MVILFIHSLGKLQLQIPHCNTKLFFLNKYSIYCQTLAIPGDLNSTPKNQQVFK
jgi:hypothetical protein